MSARSFLFVPGDRPEMLAKAGGRGADALIVDLEDAVTLEAKAAARATVGEWLRGKMPELPGGVWVRINNLPTMLGDDLEVVVGTDIAGIFLPKVESPQQLAGVDEIARKTSSADTGLRIVAMIESAAGVLAAESISRSPFCDRLSMGEVDLAGDLGMKPGADEAEFLPVRMHLALVSGSTGLPPPIGPVYADFHDLEGLRRSTERLRRLGLWSRPAIHPAQVPVINEIFTPSDDEVAAARDVVERFDQATAQGRGVCVDEQGRMIDEAVVRSARQLLATVGVLGAG